MGCEKCGSTNLVLSAIVDNRFIPICNRCLQSYQRMANVSSAQYHRDRDREKHRRDIIQPWHRGKPSKEFIDAYPEEAKNNFTEEELKKYG